jgi:hypothetical protein
MLQLCPQGPLHVERLIEIYGRKGNMSKWLSDLKGDCPKRDARRHRGPPEFKSKHAFSTNADHVGPPETEHLAGPIARLAVEAKISLRG